MDRFYNIGHKLEVTEKTNTLAYCSSEAITTEKSFKVEQIILEIKNGWKYCVPLIKLFF